MKNDIDNNEVIIIDKTRISAVWLVPAIAIIFGGWLLVKTYMEQGSFITLQFDTAQGIIVGKTKVRYKGLPVGTVTGIDVSDDFKSVIVDVEMAPSSKKMLTENTTF